MTRKRHTETVNEAVQGAVKHLSEKRFEEVLTNAFGGDFGPEPIVCFTISIRRDPKTPGRFVYTSKTKVTHQIGEGVQLFGLRPE